MNQKFIWLIEEMEKRGISIADASVEAKRDAQTIRNYRNGMYLTKAAFGEDTDPADVAVIITTILNSKKSFPVVSINDVRRKIQDYLISTGDLVKPSATINTFKQLVSKFKKDVEECCYFDSAQVFDNYRKKLTMHVVELMEKI